MEQILAKLLVSDSKVVQEGTSELKQAFKNPDAIRALCDVIVTSSNPQVRQTATVVLRRKFSKKRFWNKLNEEVRKRIKEIMIQALVNEQERSVKNGIAQIIGLLGKYEFAYETKGDNAWPELLQFVYTLCSTDNVYDKELGMYTLSKMTEMSQGSYIPCIEQLSILFTSNLSSITDLTSNIAYYTVLTMNNLVTVISGHQQMINVYCNLLPKILEIINAFAMVDETKAVELLGILEELIECSIKVVVPHAKLVTEMCLQLGSNNSIATNVQIKAITVVGWLIRTKSKVILNRKLVEPIIDVLMQLMAQQPNDENNEEYFVGDPDQFTTVTVACQTLDLVALNIPAEKVVDYILTKIEPALQSNDIYAQKATYLTLAVLSEGCSEYIRQKYLESFLRCACGAIQNQNCVVRNAAFFALGQFAEHLQPEISQYASEVLPVLFEYLNQLYIQMEKDKTEPNSLNKLFYSLETFCENLDESLMPYLPLMMERLYPGLEPSGWSMQLKRVSLSTLGAVATAVKSGLMPYFQKVIELLNVYINADPASDLHELQSEALECLALIAQNVGPENFQPLAQDTLQMAMRILNDVDDPDVRSSLYAVFGALSMTMKENISVVLPQVVERMILSIQSSEGIETYYDEDKNAECNIYGDLSSDEETPDEEDLGSTTTEDSAQCRYCTVENSYNEEKEQACLTLKDLCANTGQAFLPYIEKSFEEIFKLTDYPQEQVRKTAIEALLQFSLTLHKLGTSETKQALYKTLQIFIPKCAELIRSDEEKNVVICCLDSYTTLLQEIKSEAFVGEGHREAIMNCVIDVLTHKTMCQDTDGENSTLENFEENTDAEQDELLLQSACDIIPKYGECIKPDDFALYFPNVLQLMTIRTMKQKSVPQRSFAFGTLAECMKALDIYVEKFVPQLLQLWLSGARDSSDEVRNNSIFGLGEMILHGKEKVFSHYPEILQALSTAVSSESHAGTLDNICGALGKMIIVNSSGIPLNEVFPVYLQHLPLREDFQESEAVIKSFYTLYQKGETILRDNLLPVIKILIHIYTKGQVPNEETKVLLINFIGSIHNDFSSEFNMAASQLDQNSLELLKKLFNQ